MDRLPGTIYVHPGTFPVAVSKAILPLEEVRSDASEDTYKLSTLIYSGFDRPPMSGSEDSIASDADYLTTEFWIRLHTFIDGFSLQMAKNLIDPSGVTQMKLRPDVCLWVNGALLLKGEHKRTEADLPLAITELATKMNGWNPVALRGLTFLPCFAVGGRHLQFCAIIPPNSESSKPVVQTVSSIYNTGDLTSRLWIIRMALNMLRVLVSLNRRVMGSQISLYREIRRANDTSIVVMDDHVVKWCRPACAEIYVVLAEPPLPCATRVTLCREHRGMHILEIKPVCYPEEPHTVNELRIAIIAVLNALAELHKRKIVHRDIRWPNILKHLNSWVLSDFEFGDFAGKPLPSNIIASGHVPPELRINSSVGYGSAGDIFCVGKLLEDWRGTESLPADARAWILRLMNPDPSARPTAQQLLREQDSWLFCNNS